MNEACASKYLPCFTDTLPFGWTPSSGTKHAKNVRNGTVSDTKEIPSNRLDKKLRTNRKFRGWKEG